jgi:hypothetical protein
MSDFIQLFLLAYFCGVLSGVAAVILIIFIYCGRRDEQTS